MGVAHFLFLKKFQKMSLAVLPCFTLGKIEIGEKIPVGVAHKNEGFFSFASIMFMKSAKRKERR